MADRPLRPATRRRHGRPLPHHLADRPRAPPEAEVLFLTRPCDPVGVSGISTGFPVLSQSSGQVAHVLLTRSPLGLLWCCHQMNLVRLACVRHAASVRPEPGSNSPSRPSPLLGARSSLWLRSGEPVPGTLIPSTDWHSTECCPCQCLNYLVRSPRAPKHPARPPALAFGIHCSVFKERQGTYLEEVAVPARELVSGPRPEPGGFRDCPLYLLFRRCQAASGPPRAGLARDTAGSPGTHQRHRCRRP